MEVAVAVVTFYEIQRQRLFYRLEDLESRECQKTRSQFYKDVSASNQDWLDKLVMAYNAQGRSMLFDWQSQSRQMRTLLGPREQERTNEWGSSPPTPESRNVVGYVP